MLWKDTRLFLEADFPDSFVSAGSTRAFYIYSTGKLYSDDQKTGVTLASDGILNILNPSRATDTLFGGDYGDGLSWWVNFVTELDPFNASIINAFWFGSNTLNRVGSLTYSINAPPLTPTVSPSMFHILLQPMLSSELSTLHELAYRWSLLIALLKLLRCSLGSLRHLHQLADKK